MRAARFEETVQLASSVDDVWPLIIDTDRINRLLGLAPVRYTPVASAGDSNSPARYTAETTLAGFQVVYDELPFEWSYKKEFGVERRFYKGPLSRLSLRWRLSPAQRDKGGFEGGTTLTVRFEALPRSPLLLPIAWLGGRQTVGDLIKLGHAIDDYVRGAATNPFAEPVSPSDKTIVQRGVDELARAAPRSIAERLGKHLTEGADADCVRMRPFDIAETWGEDRRAVLSTFLHAVPVGLVELRWSIVCPSCRTSSAQVEALEDIPRDGHCQLCDITFDLDLDRAVEATFVPHAGVRVVPPMMFCMGGPARTPHVLSQVNVGSREETVLEVPAEPGRYRLFARGGARATVVIEANGPATSSIRFGEDKFTPGEILVGPDARITLHNESAEARHVKLERLEYGSLAATAHDLAMLPEFRTLFSGQLLKRGTPLKVSRTAVLFTDLTGSTALYNTVGDAAAFRLVDDHFDVLREAITETGGTVVKTMGDAVMAGFPDPASCIRAAVRCLDRFERFRTQSEHGALVHLKLGLFSGPCYVVTANGTLDYFGQTVNVASRLQHLAESGEIILEEKELTTLEPSLRTRLLVSNVFETRVKGVDRALQVVRATVAEEPAALAASAGTPRG